MGTPSSSSRDTKIYTVCDPYHGEIGASWERVFVPSFLNGISSKSDDYANLRDHLEFSDVGAVIPPTAVQLAANPATRAHGHVPRALAVRQQPVER